MAVPSTVTTGPIASLRLEQLDLSAEELREVVMIGYTAAAGCTEHDPRSLPGILAWGKGIGHLRDLTKPRGWKANRTSNYETAVHPTNSHAVALAAGTSQTGRSDGLPPRTKRPKGPATDRVVRQNAQLRLGDGTDVFAGTGVDVDDAERETWLLLHYFDRDSGEIRIELSSPREMTGAHITAWRERILLPPVEFSTDVEIAIDNEPDEAIDIDVQRKAD
jgi:hypothetical protein